MTDKLTTASPVPFSQGREVPRLLAGRLPFRLGTTSYIVPADLKTNVAALAGKVDDIEILIFESDELSNLPDAQTIEFLSSIALKTELTYTVHLPLDCRLGHRDEGERQRSVDQCLRVMELMKPIEPFAYVLHLDGDRRGRAPVDDVSSWRKRLFGSLIQLVSSGFEASAICIENLDYPYDLVAPLVDELGLSVCLDIGHILMGKYPLPEYLDQYLHRTRVVHLHGIKDGQDHHAISYLPREALDLLYSRLARHGEPQRVVSLEIFNESDLKDSLETMRSLRKGTGE